MVWTNRCGAVLLAMGLFLQPAGGEQLPEGIGREQAAAVAEAAAGPRLPAERAADPARRLREGTRLEKQIGSFSNTADRLAFQVQEGEARFFCLENLALERIAKIVSDHHDRPERLLWEVSGTLTEYRGVNYLLVTHAMLKNKQQRSAPRVAAGG